MQILSDTRVGSWAAFDVDVGAGVAVGTAIGPTGDTYVDATAAATSPELPTLVPTSRVVDATLLDYSSICSPQAAPDVAVARIPASGETSNARASAHPHLRLAMDQAQGALRALARAVFSFMGLTGRCHRWRASQERQLLDEAILVRARQMPFASTAFAPRFLALRMGDRVQALTRRVEALRHAEWAALLGARENARVMIELMGLAAAGKQEKPPGQPRPETAVDAEIARMKDLFGDCDQLIDLLARYQPRGAAATRADASLLATDVPLPTKLRCPPAVSRRSWATRRQHCVPLA
ncbi:hypothetical protein [Achromobacter aloeverae]|uniref:Uncharacterized protein n=1 Tax=Achromobacter aloeverae TaxID=1750518 RepID=A0A4V1MSK9_9BURK|nr:hypothetical protein [Achromobacter aloeverae]RXN92400.1 hypothetical protein C7R54_01180 [Achromobacter aloeverae]